MGKWAERITIVDQYAIIRKEPERSTSILISHRGIPIMQLKLFLSIGTESIKVEDADVNETSKNKLSGDDQTDVSQDISREDCTSSNF